MKKIINFYNRLEEWLLIVMMGVMATVVFLQVIFRLIGGSLPWSEELSRYLTMWITFIGMSYGFRMGSHIGVDAIKNFFPEKGRQYIELCCNIICILLSIFIALFGIEVVQTQMKFMQRSPAMQLPMWIAYLAIPVGFILSAFRNLEKSIASFQSLKSHGKQTFENGKGGED